MHFEPLNQTHIQKLFDFELQNRAFFENVIAPREKAFYSTEGVNNHIEKLLSDQSSCAYVLIDNSSIIARANFKNIESSGSAEIGYRVGQSAISNGIGSKCVAFLIQQAKQNHLKQLVAYVMSNNPASEKVLVKNGFALTLCLPNEFEHQGRNLNGFKYHLVLK